MISENLKSTKKSTGADLIECFGLCKDITNESSKEIEEAIASLRKSNKISDIVKKWND